ncbi:hypothetical protein X733_33610 [Mesorhizobium sp. L2C067A000]|nr:hypothetical protein X733_33610 [Mesorhizobium sp. L2C067A000]
MISRNVAQPKFNKLRDIPCGQRFEPGQRI